jgi:acetyl/propionyl-CoA carboxylase alpha subunit
MERALGELHVGGVRTTAPLALAVLRDAKFRAGDFDTHFLESFKPPCDPEREEVAALVAAVHRHLGTSRRALTDESARGPRSAAPAWGQSVRGRR